MVHIAALREGHTTFIMKKYNTEKFIECIARHSINEIAVAPPIILYLLALPLSKRSCLATVRFVWCGAAPLLASVQNCMINSLHPEAIIAQVWGMTEIGVSACRNPCLVFKFDSVLCYLCSKLWLMYCLSTNTIPSL